MTGSIIVPDEPFQVGPEPVAPPEPPAPPVVEDETPPPDPDMFPRDYVEELRRENAKYRTRAQKWEQAFDGYDEEQQEALLNYFQLLHRAESGDQTAAQELAEWLGDDDIPDTPAPVQSQDEYLEMIREEARKEAQRIYQERDQQRAQQEAVLEVRTKAEQLGYEFGSEDYMLLLKYANELNGDEHDDLLAAADQQVKAYRQRIIDEHLARLEKDRESHPVVAGDGVSPDLSSGPPKSFEEARDRVRERLNAITR